MLQVECRYEEVLSRKQSLLLALPPPSDEEQSDHVSSPRVSFITLPLEPPLKALPHDDPVGRPRKASLDTQETSNGEVNSAPANHTLNSKRAEGKTLDLISTQAGSSPPTHTSTAPGPAKRDIEAMADCTTTESVPPSTPAVSQAGSLGRAGPTASMHQGSAEDLPDVVEFEPHSAAVLSLKASTQCRVCLCVLLHRP